MSELLDYTDDCEIALDGNVNGSYLVAQPPKGNNALLRTWSYAKPVAVNFCNIGEVQQTEAAISQGVYGRYDATIRIPQQELGSLIPKLADQVSLAGHTWTVLHVGQGRFNDQWRLQCRDIELAAGLTDHIDIRVPDTRPTDADASDLITWKVLWPNVAAKIQAVSGTPADMHNGTLRGFVKHFIVYCALDLDLPYDTLVRDCVSNQIYEMKGYASRQSIQDLSQIICVQQPGK